MCVLSALLDLFFTCRFNTKEQIMRGCHSCCGNATQVQASFPPRRSISLLPDAAWQTTAIITAARHLLIHTDRTATPKSVITISFWMKSHCCEVVKGIVHLNSLLPVTICLLHDCHLQLIHIKQYKTTNLVFFLICKMFFFILLKL